MGRADKLIESIETQAKWKPTRPSDVVVHINVAKLDHSWSKDSEYVGPGGHGGIGKRYAAFGQWLQKGETVGMPEVTIGSQGHIQFINGRHRFSWMRDHGVKSLPVQVPPDQADEVKKLFS